MDLFKIMYLKIQRKEFEDSKVYCNHQSKEKIFEKIYCLDCGEQNFKRKNQNLFCKHLKIGKIAGQKFCEECGETLVEYLFSDFAPFPEKVKKDSARVKNLKKTFAKLFPKEQIHSEEVEIINSLSEKFNALTKKVGTFPNMKDVIYFILVKNERYELAQRVKISKSKKPRNLLEKLFEN